MLRLSSIVSVLASGLVLSVPLSAMSAETKIAVVDFQRVTQESSHAKDLQAKFDRQFGQRQRELLQAQTDLKTRDGKFQRDAAVMSEEERNKAQKEFQEARRDYVRRENEFKEDTELFRNEELTKVSNAVQKEVQNYAKAQNFDLVLIKDVVIFRKDALDITTQLITALQDKGKSTTPAAKP